MRSSLLFAFRNPRIRCAVAVIVMAMMATGCATRHAAPVEDRAAVRAPSALPAASGPSTAPPSVAAQPVPVPTYTVKRGDTLHQIALDSGLDYRELAAWNNLENANVIRVGQVLRLAAPGEAPVMAQEAPPGVTTAPLRSAPLLVESKPAANVAALAAPASAPGGPATMAPTASPPLSGSAGAGIAAGLSASAVKTAPKAIKQPYSDQAVRELTLAASAVPAPRDTIAMAAPGGMPAEPKSEPRSETRTPAPPAVSPAPVPPAAPSAPGATAGDADQLDWAWPVKGKIISGFSDTANLKGIDIAGTAGQAVHASAAGRVVYAGSGLRGYGKLIIIKHNTTYLSAYAHNREILVKEGQQVARGQKIAEMGNTDAEQVKLHFEIRRQGKPMDPTKYLPPA
jgi:lipoprotein NlpD